MYNVEMPGRYFENGQPISSILSSYSAVTGILLVVHFPTDPCYCFLPVMSSSQTIRFCSFLRTKDKLSRFH